MTHEEEAAAAAVAITKINHYLDDLRSTGYFSDDEVIDFVNAIKSLCDENENLKKQRVYRYYKIEDRAHYTYFVADSYDEAVKTANGRVFREVTYKEFKEATDI